MKHLLVIGLLFTALVTGQAQSGEVLSATQVKAIQQADAKGLADGFNENVELVLPNKTGVYSKKQAEMIIKDFFDSYPVGSFKVIHKGKKENASFAIGQYVSGGNSFRFTFLTKQDGIKVVIHQLRIEKQDE